jgi:3-deoxy-7-phosphoheptulonate synthase
MPVAFKNDTEGNLKSAVNSIVASDTAHSFFGIDSTGGIAHITSRGNPFGHVVLRGGGGKPNYQREAVQSATKIMEDEGLLPRIIIDCSHDNCNKDLNKMTEVFKNVIEQIAENDMIRGVMFESYLEGGTQPMKKRSELKPTISITDPCLDWDTTASLVTWAHQLLKEKIKIRP